MKATTPASRTAELSETAMAHRRRRLWLFACQTVVLFGTAIISFAAQSGRSFDRSPLLEPIWVCFCIALFFTTFYLFHVRERSLAWAAVGTLVVSFLIVWASPVVLAVE